MCVLLLVYTKHHSQNKQQELELVQAGESDMRCVGAVNSYIGKAKQVTEQKQQL